MSKHVVGLFDDHDHARRAIEELRERGFSHDRVSVIAADQAGEFQRHSVDDQGNIAAEGAVTGLTSGAVVGGLLGLLVGMGAIFVPGGVVLAGPIAGLAAGAAAGAATGGLLGALIGMGIPKEHADIYAESVRRGGVLVAVNPEGRDDEVENLLRGAGAVDIDRRAEMYRQEGFSGYDPNAKPYTREQALEERERYGDNAGGTSFIQDRRSGRSPVSSFPETSGLGATSGSLTDDYTGVGPRSSYSAPAEGIPGKGEEHRSIDAVAYNDPLEAGRANTGVPRDSGFDAGLDTHARREGEGQDLYGGYGSVTSENQNVREGRLPDMDAGEPISAAGGNFREAPETASMDNLDQNRQPVPPPAPPVPPAQTTSRQQPSDTWTSGTMGSAETTVHPDSTGSDRTAGLTGMGADAGMDSNQFPTGMGNQPHRESMQEGHRDPMGDHDAGEMNRVDDFRPEFERRFSHLGMSYEQALPAYEYGHHAYGPDRFQGREWHDIEANLRDEWEMRQPGTWIMYREIVRSGWDHNRTRNRPGGAQML